MFEIPFYLLTQAEQLQLARSKYAASHETWEANIWKFLIEWLTTSVHKISIKTSGSTGTPKTITHTKQHIKASALLTKNALDLMPNDNALLCLPSDKIGGMMMIVRAQTIGMNLLCIKPSSNPLLQLSNNIALDFAAFTPMQMNVMLEDSRSLKNINAIQKIILGGENISDELLNRIQSILPEVYSTFGMTETISHIALKRLNGSKTDEHYKVFDGITIATDDRNCLLINAPMLCEQTILSNDIVEIHSEKNFDWIGRWDNVINSGGIKIVSEEVEKKLAGTIPYNFFVAGIPDKILGQKAVLVLEAESVQLNNVVPIINSLNILPKLHRPKSIYAVNKFLVTNTGKINRKESLEVAKLIVKF